MTIDSERALHWLNAGAQPTETAAKLLQISGVWDAYQQADGQGRGREAQGEDAEGEDRDGRAGRRSARSSQPRKPRRKHRERMTDA